MTKIKSGKDNLKTDSKAKARSKKTSKKTKYTPLPKGLYREKLMTVDDITKVMRVSEGTVRLWIYGDGLPIIKIRGRLWVREDDFNQWLIEHRKVIPPISGLVEQNEEADV